jgi:hypothetical protein
MPPRALGTLGALTWVMVVALLPLAWAGPATAMAPDVAMETMAARTAQFFSM